MTESASFPRINYLDSIRGLAALQVLLLHFISAFWPGFVFEPPGTGSLGSLVRGSPLFFLYDGSSAVYLFFVLSGYVLTRAYATGTFTSASLVISRLVRLAIPVVASCVFALSIAIPFVGYNVVAGNETGSVWYASLWRLDLSWTAFLQDATISSLLLGYQGIQPMQAIAGNLLQPISGAYNSPLWTLSIEVHGSLIVLALLAARRVPWCWVILCALLLVLLARSHYLCFIVGHLLATRQFAERAPILRPIVATLLVVAGIGLCTVAEYLLLPPIVGLCNFDAPLPLCQSSLHLQKSYGALLVFIGLVQIAPLRQVLRHPALLLLGSISFMLYLVHSPILMGVSAFIFTEARHTVGQAPAKLLAAAIGLTFTLLVAFVFLPIDRWAVRLARATKKPRAGATS